MKFLLAIKALIALKSVFKFLVGDVGIGVAAGVATSYLGVGVGVGVGFDGATGAGVAAEPPVSAAYAFGRISENKMIATNFFISKG